MASSYFIIQNNPQHVAVEKVLVFKTLATMSMVVILSLSLSGCAYTLGYAAGSVVHIAHTVT